MASLVPSLVATTGLSSHVALSAQTAPAALTCIVKGMLEERERQRMEEMQMISVTMGVGQNISKSKRQRKYRLRGIENVVQVYATGSRE